MIYWASPIAFVMIPVVLAVVGYRFWSHSEKDASLQFSRLKDLKNVPRGLSARLTELPTLLKVVALGFAIMALARPQSPSQQVRRSVEGIDIMICLDVSGSMLIQDMKPVNRVTSAKKWIGEFIKGRTSDRIGLIVFSGEAYTRVPLTLDYPLLLKSVNSIRMRRISTTLKPGTAIGVGLADAVANLRKSKAKTKVIIFLTDGENNTGTIDPDTALQMAKGYGMKIYSVGMGRNGEAELPIYVKDAFGHTVKEYQPIDSEVNVKLLKKFADETGGKFFRAKEGYQLRTVFNDIDKLTKSKIKTDKYTRYTEMFQSDLGWAILLYIAAIILGQTLLRRGPL